MMLLREAMASGRPSWPVSNKSDPASGKSREEGEVETGAGLGELEVLALGQALAQLREIRLHPGEFREVGELVGSLPGIP